MERLREKEWTLPFEDPLRILFYQVVQERATQVNYLNMALIAKGGMAGEGDRDGILDPSREKSRLMRRRITSSSRRCSGCFSTMSRTRRRKRRWRW